MLVELVLFGVFAIGLPLWLLVEEIAHRLGASRGVVTRATHVARPTPSAKESHALHHAC